MLLQSEIEHMKEWRLRKMLRELRRGYEYTKTHKSGLRNLMLDHYATEIPRIERELERRKQTAKSAALG